MVEITVVKERNIAENICLEAGIPWADDLRIIATTEGESVINSAVFKYDGEEGEILHINGFNGDILFLDGLCRAILNIMDLNGVKYVYLPLRFRDIAKYIGFKEENGQYVLKLEGFFQCGCCHKKEN